MKELDSTDKMILTNSDEEAFLKHLLDEYMSVNKNNKTEAIKILSGKIIKFCEKEVIGMYQFKENKELDLKDIKKLLADEKNWENKNVTQDALFTKKVIGNFSI